MSISPKLELPIHRVPAIDVHAHYGVYDCGKSSTLKNQFMSGDVATVTARASEANIEWTVVSPLAGLMSPTRADAAAGNDEANTVVDRTPGLLQWIIVDPIQPRTFEQARQRLAEPKCVGIKIHPEQHGYKITEHGKALFEFAAQHDAVILTHSGQPNSLPADFVPLADAFANVTLILAHMGNADDLNKFDLQVRAIQTAKHGNIYTDTSSARNMYSRLIEWGVNEVGAEHVLFGTDTPLYFTASQRARIDHADLTDHQKQMILRDNAERLLQLPG